MSETSCKLVLAAETAFKEKIPSAQNSSEVVCGRPTMFDIIANSEQSFFSESALRETSYVAMAVSKFPLLAFVNEPVSHFTNANVRNTIKILGDSLQESMKVPESIASAYSILSPYVLDASQLCVQTSLSLALHPQLLVPNDGDGIVQLRSPHKLDHAIHHRLFAVDAPELYATSFVNANGVTIKRRNGHLAHLAVHYYMDNFLGNGTASIRTEIPRNGAQQPMDNYQHRISSFWFVWIESPNASELAILYEQIAKDNNLWSGVKKNIVLGASQKDLSHTDLTIKDNVGDRTKAKEGLPTEGSLSRQRHLAAAMA
ncbi:hypothetical protein AC249_AIPGENE10345 [Exaiptasia diaphana]|nr:hypothetical protein AC249_AIPGENE10345 [Exaiptasia diaphana]